MPDVAIAELGGRGAPAREDGRRMCSSSALCCEAARMTERRANLLLVDDRPQNLTALEAILEPLGHNLVSVNSGEAALKELLIREFACILLDVQMPDLDGFETAELIKQRERTSHIPIIFLTAISKEERHVFRGYSAGAVDYMFKPFDPDILRSKVAVFVELWEKTEQLKRQSELLREREARRASARERGALPAARRRDAADRLDGHQGRQGHLPQPPLVRVHRHDAERGWTARLAAVTHPDDLPTVVARREQTLVSGEVFEVEYRFRNAEGAYRWHLGRAVPIRDDTGGILGRHGDRHPRPQADRGPAQLHHRGSGHPRDLARLPRDARPRRAGRRPADGRLVLGRDRRGRRLDPPGGDRARRSREGRLRARAAGALPGRPRVAPRCGRSDPERRAGARARDPGRRWRPWRARRDARRPDPPARPPLVHVRPVAGT